MRTKTVLIFLSFVSAFLLQGTDLDEFIGQNYEIFKTDRPRFITRANMNYFAWTSSEKTTARYPRVTGKIDGFVYLDLPVQEVLVKFQGNKLKSIYVSIFNRGDSASITAKNFNQLLLQADAAIQKRIGIRNNPPVRRERIKNGTVIFSRTYQDRNFCYVLKWSSTGSKKKLQPEYVQIELKPLSGVQQQDTSSTPLNSGINRKLPEDLHDRVKKDSKENVRIEGIPMVDQGQKGYCFAAVMERVLVYYGAENVTQHTIAQLAKTNAETGTSVQNAITALKKVQKKFQIKITVKYQFLRTVDEFEKFYKGCCNMARKLKKPKPVLVKKSSVYLVGPTLNSTDPEVYVAVRCSDKRGMGHFLETIRERVDAGLPTLWGVTLGIVPEDKLSPNAKGGHMRLIIGYNPTNREILYTDTWGMGHELKSMPEENAWAITQYLIAVDPRH